MGGGGGGGEMGGGGGTKVGGGVFKLDERSSVKMLTSVN